MNRESELLAAIAKASTAAEQRKLMAELDDLRAERSRKVREAREIDLADTYIRDTLTPVRVHERVTAASDWLEELPESGGEYHNAMRTEATMWFKRVSSEVKADRDEFAEQAQGMARYLAGKYGTDAEAARIAFLEEVARLHRLANDSPGQVNEEQSGNAESQVTDYDTEADQEPMWGEDWTEPTLTGEQGYHPQPPGASASRRRAFTEGNEGLWIAAVEMVDGRPFPGTGNPRLESSPMPWEDAVNWVHAQMDIANSRGFALRSGGFREARKAGGASPKGRKARVAPRQAASNYLDYPEGTTAVCIKCKERILLDQREGGGPGKDWGARPEDWVGNGGIGMDYGCAGASDDEDDLGIAGEGNGHYPDISTIQLPRSDATASRKTAINYSDVKMNWKTAAGVTGQGPRDAFDKAKAAAPTHDFSVDLYDSGPGSLPAGGGQGFRKATCTRCGAKIEMQSVPSGGWYATYPNYPCLTESTAKRQDEAKLAVFRDRIKRNLKGEK